MIRRFCVDHPLDVTATLHALRNGGSDPCFRRAADGIWRATRTPFGPATLHIDDSAADPSRSGGTIAVHAWGIGAEWALEHADHLLGMHDPIDEFRPTNRVLAEALRRNPGLRMCSSLAVTEAMIPKIIGQKVQVAAAHRSWSSLVRAFGEPAPGPGDLLLPPDPHQLASLPYEAFHKFNLERARAETIRRVQLLVKHSGMKAPAYGPKLSVMMFSDR